MQLWDLRALDRSGTLQNIYTRTHALEGKTTDDASRVANELEQLERKASVLLLRRVERWLTRRRDPLRRHA